MSGELQIPFCAPQQMEAEIADAAHSGGYRTSSATKCKLRRVTGGWWLLVADRRVCAAIDNKFARRRAAQNGRLRHALREQWRYRRQGGQTGA
jgi:hypothetical protein